MWFRTEYLPQMTRVPKRAAWPLRSRAVLRERGGVWLGWSGKTATGMDDSDRLNVSERDEGNIQFALVDLTQRDLDEYYAALPIARSGRSCTIASTSPISTART